MADINGITGAQSGGIPQSEVPALALRQVQILQDRAGGVVTAEQPRLTYETLAKWAQDPNATKQHMTAVANNAYNSQDTRYEVLAWELMKNPNVSSSALVQLVRHPNQAIARAALKHARMESECLAILAYEFVEEAKQRSINTPPSEAEQTRQTNATQNQLIIASHDATSAETLIYLLENTTIPTVKAQVKNHPNFPKNYGKTE